MNVTVNSIVPVTEARARLGDLTEEVSGNKYIILTKGGEPKAAIVDVDYLANLEEAVGKIYQKTFIDPKLLAFIRDFTDGEISEWLREDKLN